MVVDGFRWFWVVVGGFRQFYVVPCFSNCEKYQNIMCIFLIHFNYSIPLSVL